MERYERAFTRGPVTSEAQEMGNVRASSDEESAPLQPGEKRTQGNF